MTTRTTRGTAFGAMACGAVLGAAGCSSAPGELILAVQTDMEVPKDIDTIRIEVSASGVPRYKKDYERLGLEGGPLLPATVGIVQSDDEPDATVTIRVSARSQQEVRVLREVVTQVPSDRVATLHVPLQFLCDGSAEEVADGEDNPVNVCPVGETCVAGTCAKNEIDAASLPEYSASDVFGGGTGHGDGVCFDVRACFAAAEVAAVDPSDCSIAAPPGEPFNVALISGRAGMCNEAGCFVALDAESPSGWVTAEGGRVRLPAAVCTPDPRIPTGVIGVATAPVGPGCPQKVVGVPTCGPWSAVGSGIAVDETRPVAVAAGGGRLGALRVADGQVFWGGSSVVTGADGVARDVPYVRVAEIAGGSALRLFDGDPGASVSLRSLAVDGAEVYWTEANGDGSSGQIRHAQLGGGTPGIVVDNQAQPEGLAASNGTVLWTDFGANEVKGGRVLDTMALDLMETNQQRPYRIATDGTLACWTNEGSLGAADGQVRCFAYDGQVLDVAAGEETPRGIAVDADAVYWVTFASPGAVRRARRNAGVFQTPETLAGTENYPNGIAVDATTIYWTNWGDEKVRSLPRAGGTPATLVLNQSKPSEIVVTDDALYWINEGGLGDAGGTIMRLAL